MSEDTPPKHREKWTPHAAMALGFTLIVAVATLQAPTQVSADPPPATSEETAADPAAVQALEADLAVLSKKVSADLDARVRAATDAVVEQATAKQIAAALQQSRQNLAMRSEIAGRRSGRQMPTITIHARSDASIAETQDGAVKIASGTLDADPRAPGAPQAPPASAR